MSTRSYLTAPQQKAIIYLAESYDEHEVAERVKISVYTLRHWMKNVELFKIALAKRIEEVCGVDLNFRRRKAQLTLKALYEEVEKRVAEGDFEKFDNKSLIRAISIIQDQLRHDGVKAVKDSPNESSEESNSLEELKNRFKNSGSGKIFREERQVRGRKVKVVTKCKDE